MQWNDFAIAAPEIARIGQKLVEKDQLVLIGTIRRDGSPRISPVEPDFANGRLYLGMIWESYKALDLRRDPRCTVHGLVHDRFASEGEFKLYGRAEEVHDLDERAVYQQAIFERLGWKPQEPRFHLFAVDIHSAALFTTAEQTRLLTLWREGEDTRRFEQTADGRRIEVR